MGFGKKTFGAKREGRLAYRERNTSAVSNDGQLVRRTDNCVWINSTALIIAADVRLLVVFKSHRVLPALWSEKGIKRGW